MPPFDEIGQKRGAGVEAGAAAMGTAM